MADHQILFDRLVYVDRLKRAGINDEQARAYADAIDAALRDAVATQADMVALKVEIAQLETRLLVRIGGMIAIATAILIGVKFL